MSSAHRQGSPVNGFPPRKSKPNKFKPDGIAPVSRLRTRKEAKTEGGGEGGVVNAHGVTSQRRRPLRSNTSSRTPMGGGSGSGRGDTGEVDESEMTGSEYEDGETPSDDDDHLSSEEEGYSETPVASGKRKRAVKGGNATKARASKDHKFKPVNNKKKKKKSDPSTRASRTYSSIDPRSVTEKRPRQALFRTACTKLDHFHCNDPVSCNDPDSASASPSTPCTDVCPLMTIFSMYFCELGVVCRLCMCMVPPAELFNHLLLKGHKHAGGAHVQPDYKFVGDHIMETHHFSASTVFNWPPEITEHVDGLQLPTLHLKCPIPSCMDWRPMSTVIHKGKTRLTENHKTKMVRQHLEKAHSDEKENHPECFEGTPTFKIRYVLRPFRNGKLRNLLVFAEDWTPPVQLPAPPLLPSNIPINRTDALARLAPGAQFLQILHYPQYVASLNASNRRLRQLVQLPNRGAVTKLKHKPTRFLEIGLWELYELLSSYLSDSNVWLDEHHPQARAAFVYK